MFSRMFFFLVLFGASLFSKTVYWLGQEGVLAPKTDLSNGVHTYDIWEDMAQCFKSYGLDLKFLTISDIARSFPYYRRVFSSADTAYVVIENVMGSGSMNIFYRTVPERKRALVAWEPPTVLLEMYSEQVLTKFAKMFTFSNKLVDHSKFFKLYYHTLLPMTKDPFTFSDKKFACMIYANKGSAYPLELYSLRRKVIEFFAKDKNRFDLYGRGWPLTTPNYKGTVGCKIETIKKYKFCFAMENTRDISGYMTEKIFDVFAAGSIPIYWGDSTVEKEIPSECFIDFRKFASLNELVAYLQNMSQDEYDWRVSCIKKYLDSEAASRHSYANYNNILASALSN